ncbi:unnamed protein product [Trifolium pratense]|uniref:Uncharacterized protein n=1 Tax=Trifolium pratense TaxID=57577 RepID=A0ACB0K1H1_TRIPR|nr:unnamed protein product [Trifolium pratense]
MAKNLKLVPAIILFLFLFRITKEDVSGPKIIVPSITCTSTKDCPKVSARSKYVVNVCMDGYCHRMIFKPKRHM